MPARPGRVFVGLLLVLVACNLRPLFSSLSAVLPEMMGGTGASPAAASVATTLPVVCLGLFAPLAPALARRFGPERVVLALLLLLAAGTALRGLASYGAIVLGSVAAGAAIALGNVLLPGLVKRDFPDRAALMTGLYVMGICGGGALGAGLTVPLAERLASGWSGALAAWAVPAVAVAGLALPWAFRGRPAAPGPRVGAGWLWRDRLAWRITLMTGLQSAMAYIVFGWLAPILRERGIEAGHAGLLLSLSFLVQLGSSLVTPWFASRGADQRATMYGLVGLAAAGYLGALFAPLPAVPAFVLLQGAGQGGLLAAAMLIILLRSPDGHVAAQLSGMAQGVGYLVAAAGPLLAGFVRSVSGGFAATGALFLALALGTIWAASTAGRVGQVGARRGGTAAEP